MDLNTIGNNPDSYENLIRELKKLPAEKLAESSHFEPPEKDKIIEIKPESFDAIPKFLKLDENFIGYPPARELFPKLKSLDDWLLGEMVRIRGRTMPDTVSDAKLILQDKDSSGLSKSLGSFMWGGPYLLEKDFLAGLIKQSAPDIDLKHYTIRMDFGKGQSIRHLCMFYDAPYTFRLCYDSEPIASISFSAEDGAVLVRQIQGVKGSQDKLKPLKWERALLAVVCDWVADNNVPEVMVLPSHKNRWSNISVSESGRMRYDVTAKRSGFVYDKEMDVYRKSITPVNIHQDKYQISSSQSLDKPQAP